MKLLLIYTLLLFSLYTYAQQDNYHTLFWNKMSLINPASSAVKQKYYGALVGREQWSGNNTFWGIAIFDAKIMPLRSGAGINFAYEKIDPFKSYNANLNYNYQISFSEERILSIGLSGGVVKEKVDLSKIDPGPIIIKDNINFFSFKFGLFYTSNHFDIGLSSAHIKIPNDVISEKKINSVYWLYSSYWFYLLKNLSVQPNFLIKMYDYGLNHTLLYSGLLFTFRESLWTGISYSTNGNIGGMIGYDIIKKFRVGYSFDFIKSKNSIYGNHEIILGIIIK